MNARPLLLALRRGLVRVLGAIDSATAEPEKLPDENELLSELSVKTVRAVAHPEPPGTTTGRAK